MKTKKSDAHARLHLFIGFALAVPVIGLSLVLTLPGYAGDTDEFPWKLKGPVKVLPLARSLEEISGLALGTENDLIAHGDEIAISHRISAVTGAVISTHKLKYGRRPVLGDFEGVAQAEGVTWLINSRGFLFRAGPDANDILAYNTGLEGTCEVEGLAHIKARNAFIIACKRTLIDDLKGKAVLFIWSYETRTLDHAPITIDLEKLRKRHKLQTIRPSGVWVLQDGSGILVLSSKPPAILVLETSGLVLGVHKLRKKRHPQPEGIAVMKDGTLVIADEGEEGPGTLTLYRPDKTL